MFEEKFYLQCEKNMQSLFFFNSSLILVPLHLLFEIDIFTILLFIKNVLFKFEMQAELPLFESNLRSLHIDGLHILSLLFFVSYSNGHFTQGPTQVAWNHISIKTPRTNNYFRWKVALNRIVLFLITYAAWNTNPSRNQELIPEAKKHTLLETIGLIWISGITLYYFYKTVLEHCIVLSLCNIWYRNV